MAAPLKYNPLLKRCLQETADTSQIESDIFDIKTLLNSLTKDNNGNYIVSIPTKFLDNVTVEGTQTVVKTQEIQSENDYIVLRAGNPLGLAPGAYSGFRIANYDGNNNNCLLVVDADGWARIGDENETIQKIATIEENPVNGALVAYNTQTKQLESQNVSLSDYVKKFDDSEGAKLGNDEIGQYQGENTANLKNGFFYKKSNTIPANTWYFQIENDVYVDNTKIINKGLYTYDNSSQFNVTTDYVDKRTNGGQPMLYFVKNPVVGVGAIKRNMSTNTITNVVITDITGDNITVNDGSIFNDTVENSSYGVMDKFVNENGDVVFIPFTQTEGKVIDGSTILSVVISVINNTYNCYAPYPSPITIHKSDGSQGGNLTQTDTQPQPPIASENELGLIKVGLNLAINANGVLNFNLTPQEWSLKIYDTTSIYIRSITPNPNNLYLNFYIQFGNIRYYYAQFVTNYQDIDNYLLFAGFEGKYVGGFFFCQNYNAAISLQGIDNNDFIIPRPNLHKLNTDESDKTSQIGFFTFLTN